MNKPISQSLYEPTVIDIFSGVGGLSLGAARAGFTVKAAIENDKHAVEAHSTNFPHSIHLEKDISKLNSTEILATIGMKKGELDGIIGGPPCQGFSAIGHQKRNDPRNKLFVHFFQIVSEVRPKFFLAENVPGIMTSAGEEIRQKAMSLVEGDYCILPPIILTASDFGAPTTRKRVFFIGYLQNEMKGLNESDFHAPGRIDRITVRKALKGLPLSIDPNWQSSDDSWRKVALPGSCDFSKRLWGHVPKGVGNTETIIKLKNEQLASGSFGTRHSERVAARYAKVLPGKSDTVSKSRKLELDGFCPTLRAGTGPERGSYQAVRPLHPTENRVITPREAARLQGFPDWFQFSPTKWHSFRQIGNSVSPILAEKIFKLIFNALKN
ncbi:MAG: DNA cytosine methyltransferase [Deltaproteobacteria bacterium]|nr:DNA cytosine methyltransferase [Deltaproteobacteria bacterium]